MQKEDRPVRIIPDKKHKDMWRLEWDGAQSADFYNWTWANHNLANYDQIIAGNVHSGFMVELWEARKANKQAIKTSRYVRTAI